jgi:hypothetical protein
MSRVIDTDKGPLHLLRVHADPLIVRVPSFLAPSEIQTLLAAVTSESQTSSSSSDGSSSESAAASSSNWERYKPYHAALGRDAISDIATMSKRELRCMPQLAPLLDTIASRVARVCQANVTCISSLKEVLRYEPGQAFLLHKVRGMLHDRSRQIGAIAVVCPHAQSSCSLFALHVYPSMSG